MPGSPAPEYHGYDGYLGISYAPYRTKIADAIVNSSIQYGIPYVDYNGPTQVKPKTYYNFPPTHKNAQILLMSGLKKLLHLKCWIFFYYKIIV